MSTAALTVVPVNNHSSANYHGGRPCAEIRDGNVRIAIVSSVEETREATDRNAHLMKAAGDLYEALSAYVKSRAHDLGHGEECPKHYCGDNDCDGKDCGECEGRACDCDLDKIIAAYVLGRAALAKARGEA